MQDLHLRGLIFLGEDAFTRGLIGGDTELILLEYEKDEEECSDDNGKDADVPK
jgi:hypothetical protein